MRTRFITAAIGIPVVLPPSMWGPVFHVFMAAYSPGAMFELCRMLGLTKGLVPWLRELYNSILPQSQLALFALGCLSFALCNYHRQLLLCLWLYPADFSSVCRLDFRGIIHPCPCFHPGYGQRNGTGNVLNPGGLSCHLGNRQRCLFYRHAAGQEKTCPGYFP